MSRTVKLIMLLAVILVVGGSGGAAYLLLNKGSGVRPDLVTHKVTREKLQLMIVERGTLESADNREVICRVKAGSKGSTVASTIKWVIDDGSYVRQGQLIVELDDSGLQEQLKTQRITLDKARSDMVTAEENYKITESQNLSDIKTAEIAVQLAELDLEKFTKGEYEQNKKDIEGRIKIAESDLEQWRERVSWSDRMLKRGYVSSSQAQADHSRLQSAEISLAKVNEEMRVLEKYTYVRTKTDLESKVAEAKRALDRVQKTAESKRIQADSDRSSKKSIYEQEASRTQDLEDEIRKCMITAPQDGMVVYFVSEQSRGGMGSQQSIIAQGEPVREGQKLMRIPDLKRMLVNTKVHEALVSRVRGEVMRPTGFGDALRAGLLTQPNGLSRMVAQYGFAEVREKFRDKELRQVFGGQAARVRIDAFPDRSLKGHVKTVGTVASQSDWMTADVKTYQTMISIDESVDGLKPGMSAEVNVLADTTGDPVLTVPVQAVVGAPGMGAKRKCFVLLPDGNAEERDIELGLSNEKMVEVRSGLNEGDDVVLNPRVLLGEKSKMKPMDGKNGASADFSSGEAKASKEGIKGEGRGKGKQGGGDEDRQKQMERWKNATPEEKKAMMDALPPEVREKMKMGAAPKPGT